MCVGGNKKSYYYSVLKLGFFSFLRGLEILQQKAQMIYYKIELSIAKLGTQDIIKGSKVKIRYVWAALLGKV